MGNAPEVVREVGVDDVRVPLEQEIPHLGKRLVGVAPRTVSILLRWKVSVEDRLQHQHRCCHADPISHSRNAQRPFFAVGLRDERSSDRFRSIRLLSERKRQFAKPPFDPIRFDIREVLAIYPRCALVGAALGIRMSQDVFARDLVVQGIEAELGFCLRFRV